MAVAMLVMEAVAAKLGLVWTNRSQETVTGERLGRVASIDALGSQALLPDGFRVAGILADRLGPSPVFVRGGAISALVIGLRLLHPAVRNLD